MAIGNRGIGWTQESNLLYQILKQLTRLTSIIFGLAPKYKVYTALLTQTGNIDITQYINYGPVTQGVTYFIDDTPGGASDFTNVGGLQYPECVNTYFVAINSDTPNEYDGAVLQYNAGAPVTTVLENTIGNIWWTGISGNLTCNSNNLFLTDKTFTTSHVHYVVGNDQMRYFGADLESFTESSIPFSNVEALQYTNVLNTPVEIRVYN